MDSQKTVDLIFMKLRPFGPYQLVGIAYSLTSFFIVAVLVLNYYIIGYSPPHHCRPLEDPLSQYGINTDRNLSSYTAEYQQCNVKLSDNQTMSNRSHIVVGCLEGYQFDYEFGDTLITEWNLVCSQKGVGETSHTMVMAGQIVGATVFTTLADRYGRKPVFVSTHFLLFTLSLASAFVPSFVIFAIMRFVLGAFQQGMGLSLSILFLELFPQQYRGIMGAMGQFVWTAIIMLMAVIAYLMRYTSWRYFVIVTSLFSFHAIFSYWILDESVRWLFVNNRRADAMKIIKKIARRNNVDYEQVVGFLAADTELEENAVHSDSESSYVSTNLQPKTNQRVNFFSIFRNKLMLKYSLINWFVWFVNSLTYFGLYLISTPLTGNRYLDFFLNGLAELPGAILFMLCVNRIGRRRSSIAFHSLTGVSLISSVMLYSYGGDTTAVKISYVVLNYIGKTGIAASFALLFLYTPELYPTNLRNIGLGVCSSFARIGGMIAPYCNVFASYVLWGPGVVFGVCCIVVALLATQLPETNGRELPQTIDDIEAWSKQENNIKHVDIQADN